MKLSPMDSSWTQELQLDDFDYFATMMQKLAGVTLGKSKFHLVQGRLRARFQALGLKSFSEYRFELDKFPPGKGEWLHFLNALTTNKTDWFREPDHFDYLAETFLPHWKRRNDRLLYCWSAACSTGEEPYSLAMTFTDFLGDLSKFWIFSTDINSEVLHHASNGVYENRRLSGLPDIYKERFLVPGSESLSNWVKVRSSIRQRVTFSRHNLVNPSPYLGRFHLIFCRNVLIYFSKSVTQRVINELYQGAAPGALLFIGHSESLQGIETKWKSLKPSIYLKEG